jgi:hypothetical protein
MIWNDYEQMISTHTHTHTHTHSILRKKIARDNIREEERKREIL